MLGTSQRWCSFHASLAGCDAPNLVATFLDEPEVAVRSGCDPVGVAAGCWDWELGDPAIGADTPNLVAIVLSKPEIAVRSGCDPCWPLPAVGTGNSVIVPLGLIRPILSPLHSINQRLPSGPAVIKLGLLPAVGTGNSVILPLGLMRPILFPLHSANQKLPSGPAVIAIGLPWP